MREFQLATQRMIKLRVCLIYDCLFPYTVGGAERWMRSVAEQLVMKGHDVTYLTLSQWNPDHHPDLGPIRVISVGPRMNLYVKGRRRVLPPLVFGLGVFWHLITNRHRYDLVHTAAFPYFSLLAAGLVRRFSDYTIVADWHEVWSTAYWREYLGNVGGRIGELVQKTCARIHQQPVCFSEMHAQRLRVLGVAKLPLVLRGEYDGSADFPEARENTGEVLFAGRLIAEKGVVDLVNAVALAHEQEPALTCTIIGDGPERERIEAAITAANARSFIHCTGFLPTRDVHAALGRALCLALPSRREGYGLVAVEALSRGTPVIVTRAPDNAAKELITPRVNGTIIDHADPEALSAAIIETFQRQEVLRQSTRDWFLSNQNELSLNNSLVHLLEAYGRVKMNRCARNSSA